MELSVIIVAKKEDFFIRRLLSFLADFEVEIMVSASGRPGDTPDICREFDARYLHSPVPNRAIQSNAGAMATSGDLLLFLHADVLPPKSFYQEINNAVMEGYDFGLFSFRFDSTMSKLAWNAAQTRKDNLFTGGGDQCHFYKREFFEQLGGYREDFVFMEDFELFKRAGKQGRYKLVREDALVSARKFERNAWLRVQLANALAFGMFKAGFGSKWIKRVYWRLLN